MEHIEYKKIASRIRMDVIEEVHSAGSGHPGGSLSAADIVTALYFGEMNIDPKNPQMKGRDKFVLSKGHAAPVQYAALAEKGYFPKEELTTLRKLGSRLQGHPNMHKLPGIEMSTGSLGQGFAVCVGYIRSWATESCRKDSYGRLQWHRLTISWTTCASSLTGTDFR